MDDYRAFTDVLPNTYEKRFEHKNLPTYLKKGNDVYYLIILSISGQIARANLKRNPNCVTTKIIDIEL